MAVVLIRMAHNNSNAANNTSTPEDIKPTTFHDFLGRGCASDSSPAAAKTAAGPRPEASPSASPSLGASSGGGRGPISTTSDLGSERQVGNHFEGVPFYRARSDISGGPEISNRFAGSKRSSSDSAFMGGSPREGLPQLRPDSQESSHFMKMLRNEETFSRIHPMRPSQASLIMNPPPGGRTDANYSKMDRAIPINIGPAAAQYPPRVGQVSSFGYQSLPNRLKDLNAGPSIISQAAADEGSRTGIKGSGILSSGGPPSGGKPKPIVNVSEPEASIHPSRHGLTSGSRQMTIFYAGQAHVFDDVHPNKADVIMALAGSDGGSWSTTFAPKPGLRPTSAENYTPSGGRLSLAGTSSDRISIPQGVHQGGGGGVTFKDSRNLHQVAEPGSEEKT